MKNKLCNEWLRGRVSGGMFAVDRVNDDAPVTGIVTYRHYYYSLLTTLLQALIILCMLLPFPNTYTMHSYKYSDTMEQTKQYIEQNWNVSMSTDFSYPCKASDGIEPSMTTINRV